MKGRFWTETEIGLLRKRYAGTAVCELAQILGRTVASVRSRAKLLHLGERRYWSAEDIEQLRSLYPGNATAKVAALLKRPIASVYGHAFLLGLHKTPEFYESNESGRLRKGETLPGCVATQFQKGLIPANKGLRRPGWGPGRMKETQFQRGARSGIAARNWRPIGTILPDPEGYLRIKVREALPGEAHGFGNTKVWPLYGRCVWEQHHGPIPPSHNIVFKDRNRANCAIENLECVSRADMARRNAMWGRFPEELVTAIMLNGALKRKVREAQR